MEIRLNPGSLAPDTGGPGSPTIPGVLRSNTNSNTHIPPHPPVLKTGVLADGIEDSWLEYVPRQLPTGRKPPLIISCHGGGAMAQLQFDETSWCYIAEREGCIAVFPNAGGQRRSWLTDDQAPPRGGRPSMLDVFTDSPDGCAAETHHHIRFLKALIERMRACYDIDEGRVCLQGMSMEVTSNTALRGVFSPLPALSSYSNPQK